MFPPPSSGSWQRCSRCTPASLEALARNPGEECVALRSSGFLPVESGQGGGRSLAMSSRLKNDVSQRCLIWMSKGPGEESKTRCQCLATEEDLLAGAGSGSVGLGQITAIHIIGSIQTDGADGAAGDQFWKQRFKSCQGGWWWCVRECEDGFDRWVNEGEWPSGWVIPKGTRVELTSGWVRESRSTG